jgi:HlyD family secretion protein
MESERLEEKKVMRKRYLGILVVAVLLVCAAAGLWYLSSQPGIGDQLLADLGLQTEVAPAGVLAASGIIEAEEVSVTTELGGRVAEVLADEGDLVEEGTPLFRLDDALLQAQMTQAEAALEGAQATLAQVETGASEADIAQAEALLHQAEVARDGALQALDDAKTARAEPQQLEAQIDAARTQLAIAELNVQQAIANARASDVQTAYFERTYPQLVEGFDVEIPVPGLPIVLKRHFNVGEAVLSEVRRQGNLANQEAWMAWEGLLAAEEARDGARQNLRNLLDMRENPLEANALVSAAEAQYLVAEANVEVAQAQLEALRGGATDQEVGVAQSLVEQADAALGTLQVQLDKMTLYAPRTGVVLERMVSVGEIAPPNFALLTLADLDQVTLTVYVPENEIGLVKVGQAVRITVDSYPERTFEGKVVHIASSAEFTPKNVQTKEERVSTVFAVKIEIPNLDHALKPGMPADAQILVEG